MMLVVHLVGLLKHGDAELAHHHATGDEDPLQRARCNLQVEPKRLKSFRLPFGEANRQRFPPLTGLRGGFGDYVSHHYDFDAFRNLPG